jgi:DNA-binding NtrC family response regulator
MVVIVISSPQCRVGRQRPTGSSHRRGGCERGRPCQHRFVPDRGVHQTGTGRFREDLFFRLNVFPIRVTPLRERHEDIPLLLMHFLAKFNRMHGRRLTGFTQRAVDAVMSYDWPGNIRALENVVERGVILTADSSVIDAPQLFTSGEQFVDKHFTVARSGSFVKADVSHLLDETPVDSEVERVAKAVNALLLGGEDAGGQASLDDVETLLLQKALERAKGNVSAAARILGITRPQMVYRLKSRGITSHVE